MMAAENIFIFFEHGSEVRYTKTKAENLTENRLEIEVKKLFPKIGTFEYFCNKTVIRREDIIEFILSMKSSNITIELFSLEKSSSRQGTLEINSNNLKSFAIKHSKWEPLLKTDDPIKKENRLKIMEMSCEFLRSATKKDNPSNYEKGALSVAIRHVFPAFKNVSDEEMLKHISFKNKNDLKVIRALRADAMKARTIVTNPSPDEHETMQNMLSFLKREHIIIHEEKLLKYLARTVDWRVDEMRNKGVNIKSEYNFFTTRPEFILHDFKNRYKESADNFYNEFESVLVASAHLFSLTNRRLPDSEWPEEIQSYMYVFHFLKTPAGQKKPTTTLVEMMNNFVVFQKVGGTEIVSQAAPILIAVGLSPRNIDKYQIHLEFHTFDLPDDISFLRAVDYLMKSFYIFNMKFPKMLSEFYNFVMLNIYKISEKDAVHDLQLKTTSSREYQRQLQKILEE